MTNSRVYENAGEGFRFLVPEGWMQMASANLPPGPLDREQPVSRYTLSSTVAAATFMVLCVSENVAADLEAHHSGPFLGVKRWTLVKPLTEVIINGAPAERIEYEGMQGDSKVAKVVTCFRRNGRVYSFVGVFSVADEMTRQEIERTTNDIIWER